MVFTYPFWGTFINKQRHGNPPLTPAWALECWLWEDDENTAERVDSLLADPQSEENIKTALEKIKTPFIATDMGELSQDFVDEAPQIRCNYFYFAKRI